MAEKLVELFERFFLDLVATITPGILLIAGLVWIAADGNQTAFGLPHLPQATWWIVLPVAYAAGHLLTAVGEGVLVPVWRKLFATRVGKPMRPAGYKSVTDLPTRPSLLTLKELVPVLAPVDVTLDEGRSVLRNIALTVVGSENLSTIVRFTAIALFSLGLATGSLVLAVVYAALHAREYGKPDIDGISQAVLCFVAAGFVAVVMMRRYFEFWSRSQYLQFDMLAGILAAQRAGLIGKNAAPSTSVPEAEADR